MTQGKVQSAQSTPAQGVWPNCSFNEYPCTLTPPPVVAWLVEFPAVGDDYSGGERIGPARQTQWLSGEGRLGAIMTRTSDANKAIRFAREADANAMILILNDDSCFKGFGSTNAIATEHMWIGASQGSYFKAMKEAADRIEKLTEALRKITHAYHAVHITYGADPEQSVALAEARAALSTEGLSSEGAKG